MDRTLALEALKLRIENTRIIKHSLIVEAIMRRLAKHFHEDVDLWGISGIVHDIDLERICEAKEIHGMMGGNILEGLDYDETIVYAVRAHNPENNLPRRRRLDKALYCADPMANFIFACAQTLPDKNLCKVSKSVIIDHFNKQGFEEHNKEQIATCSELDLKLEEFIELSLEAIQSINSQLEIIIE